MPSPSLNPGQDADEAGWAARLIPGTYRTGEKKKPHREMHAHFRVSHSDTVIPVNCPTGTPRSRVVEWLTGFLRVREWLYFPLKKMRQGGHGAPSGRNVLIVGSGPLAQQIANSIEANPEMERTFCGFLDDRKPPGSGVVGRTCDLAHLARTGFIDEVIVATPHNRDLTLRVLRTAQQLRLDVKMAPDLFGCEPTSESQWLGSLPLISLHEEKMPVTGLSVKRVLDVAVSGLTLILLAPALVLIAILIKLESPGPVLHAAPRAGRKGYPFCCYKFRTMVKNAEALKDGLRERNERRGPFFKITGDPRVTRLGRFLRRYSLDELPQLWNVLKGEMSLVGPRPHPIEEFSAYAIEHLPRLDMTPGITGLWQVTARRNPSFQTGMRLDIEYIHRWSLIMDLKILLKTAGAVLRGSGD